MNHITILISSTVIGFVFGYIFKGYNRRRPISSSYVKNNHKLGDRKMVFVVRSDLNMTREKVACQCVDVALRCVQKIQEKCPEEINIWKETGQPKIVLKAKSKGEEELRKLKQLAKGKGLVCSAFKYTDDALLKNSTLSMLGIGPGLVLVIDEITGDLKLYK